MITTPGNIRKSDGWKKGIQHKMEQTEKVWFLYFVGRGKRMFNALYWKIFRSKILTHLTPKPNKWWQHFDGAPNGTKRTNWPKSGKNLQRPHGKQRGVNKVNWPKKKNSQSQQRYIMECKKYINQEFRSGLNWKIE